MSFTDQDIEKGNFLTAMGLIMGKHSITWGDVEVDFEKGTINILTDMEPGKIADFILELNKVSGGFD